MKDIQEVKLNEEFIFEAKAEVSLAKQGVCSLQFIQSMGVLSFLKIIKTQDFISIF